ncbi:MAG: arnC 3 [Verrucomicrobia bacterium]|jgi:SAM-dependent methyltransferase|nr:arnC 3 [Verrucomicrobiota bacterium]
MTQPLGRLSADHLDSVRAHFDKHAPATTRASRSYRRLLAGYYNRLIPPGASVLEIGCGDGELLVHLHAGSKTGVDLSEAQLAHARARIPEGTFIAQAGELLDLQATFDVIILSETLDLSADVQRLLEQLATVSTPATRLLINFHNNLWRPVFSVGEWLKLRAPVPVSSWLSSHDVTNLLELSQWEIIKRQPRLLWPIETPVLAPLLNRWIAPLLPFGCLAIFTIARLRPLPVAQPLSVSVIIPARNEAGNIESAVLRTPEMGIWTELIFVEGHSRDNTWEEIDRVRAAYPGRRITTLRQTGKGKGNAVREGYAVAQGDILMILDADLTMPPEELPKFYDAIATGKAEFANGSRLVYPMDEKAMQFLNMIANKFFGVAFSWLLGQRVKDTLCGTKVLRRSHYLTIAANRSYFGEFDPFGDFDLLFGADKQNLKIRDIPIRYRERTYGTTNIQRWRHGLLLFRMLGVAARKLKFV